MATQVFLHDTAATTHRGTNTAGLNTTTSGWLPKATGTTRGAGVVSKATNTVAGATNGVEVTNGAAATRLEWITPPVDADVTIAGTITANIWANESANNANTAINFRVQKIDAATGALTNIITSARVTELTTTNAAVNFTGTPASTAVNKGDRLRITIFGDDAGTMGTGFTFTTAYAGTTGAASGDTYLQFTETFGFQTTDPTTTTVYLTDTASAVATADMDREAWTSRGSSALTDVTATAAGWTAPVQVTDTALTSLTSQLTDNNVVPFGDNTSYGYRTAQSFQIASTATAAAVDLKLYKNGTPTDNVVLSIQADSAGAPSGTALTSVTIAGTSLGTSSSVVTRFIFDAGISLTGSTTYWLVADRSGSVDASNYYQWRTQDSGTAYSGGVCMTGTSGGAWSGVGGADIYFNLYSGGVPVSWFTKPLTAFTLSGLVKVNRRVLVSNAAANASVGVEIARVDSDGTNATVWGYANRDAATTSGGAGEVALTETAYACYVAGDDLAISNGQRIRIRLFNDDCADVPEVTGHTLTSYYGGTSGGASGDTYLVFGQTLTEFSAGTTVPVSTAGAITFTGQTVAFTQTQAVTAGAITFTGQTVTAGAAATTTTVDVTTTGAFTLTGQTVAFRQAQNVVAGAVTFTGGSIGLRQAQDVTAGALTFTGQAVAFRQTQNVTAGALTFTGQSVAFTQSQAVTAGAITFTGQTVTAITATVLPVSVAGAITLTGQTVAFIQSQGVSAGALTFTGQSVGLRQAQNLTAGVITFTGQSVATSVGVGLTAGAITFTGQTVATSTTGATAVNVDTAGAITFAGQAVAFRQAQGVTAGAVTFTGQAVAFTQTQNVTAGAFTLTGQSVAFRQTQNLTAGQVTFTGQTVTAVGSAVVSVTTSGAVTLTGQSVAFRQTQNVVAGAVTFTGQTINFGGSTSVDVSSAGALTFTGQSVAFRQTQNVVGGAVTFTGSSVAFTQTQNVTAGAFTLTGQTVGTVVAVLVPVTTAGAITVTGQTVAFTQRQNVTTAGVLTFTGGTVTPVVAVIAAVTTAGQLTLTGQSVAFRQTQSVTSSGAITFAGQSVGAIRMVPVTAGQLTFTGQAAGLRVLLGLTAGAITFTGQPVTVFSSGSLFSIDVSTPGRITFTGQAIGTLTQQPLYLIESFEGILAGAPPSGEVLIETLQGAHLGAAPMGDVLVETRVGVLAGGAAAGSVLVETRRGTLAGAVGAGDVLVMSGTRAAGFDDGFDAGYFH